MTISLGNAIKCIKEDEKWITKILVGGFVFIIMQIATSFTILKDTEPNVGTLIAAIIAILTSLWSLGFTFSSMKKIFNSDKFQMAELNEGNLILVGLKSCFAILGYGILMTIILTIIGLLYSVIAGLIGAIIFFALGLIVGLIGGTSDNPIVLSLIILYSTLVGLLGGLFFAQFVNTALAFYLKRLKFGDLISFGKHFVVISENKHTSWTLVGKMILFSLAFIAIILGLTVSIIGVLLLPFVIFASYFVAYNLLAQYAKEIEIEKYLQ